MENGKGNIEKVNGLELMELKSLIKGEQRIEAYFKIIKEKNSVFSVMSRKEVEKGYENFINFHVIDALVALRTIKDGSGGKRLVDIGSGGGLPAVSLAIIGNELLGDVVLVEASGRKCEFLNMVVEKLGLENVSVINERAEIAGKDVFHREKYDISTIRAVGGTEESLELTMPFVAVGGVVIQYKGEISPKEVEFSTEIAGKFGGKFKNIVNYSLEGSKKDRNLAIFVKTQETDMKYPRRPGMPRKRSELRVKALF